jgi:hypothetical protein
VGNGRRGHLARIFALVGLFVFLAPLTTASAGAKPVLLLFHAGGFCFGKPAWMNKAAAYARPRFQPVKVDYPLCDLSAALRYSMNEARSFSNRKVYAYGESAGGSIAARLGEMGLAKQTAVQDPVANVVKFARPYREYFGENWLEEARWMSPDRHPSNGPIRAWIARDDSLAPDSWRWAKKDQRVVGKAIPGTHLQQPYKTEAMHAAVDYLASR